LLSCSFSVGTQSAHEDGLPYSYSPCQRRSAPDVNNRAFTAKAEARK
jgi:hypothetical protein